MRKISLVLTFLFFVGVFTPRTPALAATSVVNALLFYSPTCPHCHKVMSVDLPPIIEKYEEQLVIVAINVMVPDGGELYQLVVATFNIPEERRGVPTMIVGDTVLVGEVEISTWLPQIIENSLPQGGIDWPPLPGLTILLETQGLLQPEPIELTLTERLALDPVGNSLAVAVLVGMLVSILLTGYAFLKGIHLPPWPGWVFPLLILLGLSIAGYLSYIEITSTTAICGPVGDCNIVQQSEYARLFGILPIGILGVIGYAGICIAWLLRTYSSETLASIGALVLWGIALIGTAFSIYLTFLEPFVIGATCAWCLSSSIIMTLLLWASTPYAKGGMALHQN